ncbi:MAG: PAS domain S-box protein [Pseudomonadales bacterium]|nr:PAS domain S-box protein [Pseudomonadales bacterium]
MLESEESYKRLFNKAAGGILILDAQGCIQSFNAKSEDIFGYQARDVEGRNVRFLMAHPADDYEPQLLVDYEAFKGAPLFNEGKEMLARRSNGDVFSVFVVVSTIHEHDERDRQFLAVVHDLSEIKKLESNVLVSEEKYQLLTDAAGDAILVLNRNVVERVNKEFENLFGYDAFELVGKPLQIKLFSTDLVFAEGQDRAITSEGIRKQGERFPIEVFQKTKVLNADLLKVICIRDRSEHLQQQSRISRAELDLANTNQQKAQMMAAMSHELRSPVNSILGFSQLLDMDAPQMPDRQREAVVEINSAAKDLLALVEAFFDLAKIESGTFVVSMETVDIVPIINDCVEIIKPLAKQRGIKIFNHLSDASRYFVYADETRLKQVFLNLITNAVKFNHADGTVTVSVESASNNRLRVSITDSGIGLTEEEQVSLFEPFQRLQTEREAIKGAGIGLVIAKNLIELMGGAIGLESYKYVGSTFWLELDLRMEALAPVSDISMVEGGRRIGDNDFFTKNKTIFYVSGNSVSPRLIEILLEKISQAYLVKVEPEQLGSQLLATESPDLILIDVDLHNADGDELLTRTCALTKEAKTPVLALGIKELEGGSDHVVCFSKPIELDRLAQAINANLSLEAKSAS